jgi:hypothetical protein
VGRRVRYRLELDSTEAVIDGYVSYDCRTGDGTAKTVWMLAGEEAADEMEVEARLVVCHHPGWSPFPAFTEYRLMDARRCR